MFIEGKRMWGKLVRFIQQIFSELVWRPDIFVILPFLLLFTYYILHACQYCLCGHGDNCICQIPYIFTTCKTTERTLNNSISRWHQNELWSNGIKVWNHVLLRYITALDYNTFWFVTALYACVFTARVYWSYSNRIQGRINADYTVFNSH